MNVLQAIILGLIQGLTEFLPVSSSGHLVFAPVLFGWTDPGLAFDVVLHLGTLLAVIVYFRKRLWQLLVSLCDLITRRAPQPSQTGATTPPDRALSRVALFLIVSVIPAGAIAFFFGDAIEHALRATWIVGVSLIVWGIVLWVADRAAAHRAMAQHTAQVEHMTWKQTIIISCAQAIALIPGTSRSGITMTAGLFSKLDKKTAAEFSFLMSVPVIALAGAAKILDLVMHGGVWGSTLPYVLGFVVSAVSGFFSIAALMKIIQRWSFTPFVVYRIVVGVLILIFFI